MPAFVVSSSQANQEPHGVSPPAQLRIVPDKPTHWLTNFPFAVSSTTVLPPMPVGTPASYTVPSTRGTGTSAFARHS